VSRHVAVCSRYFLSIFNGCPIVAAAPRDTGATRIGCLQRAIRLFVPAVLITHHHGDVA
jgi:hypothetical protein